MDLLAKCLIVLWALASNLPHTIASKHNLKVQFDKHYTRFKTSVFRDEIGYPNRRRTQLYSRNSGRFVQVLPNGKVVAKGSDGNKYADLEILSVAFGKVHIRALEMDLYICFDKREHLIAKKRPTARCIFREQHGKDAYSMYESEEFNGKFLAFSRKGLHRFKAESKIGNKAVQFVERPPSELVTANSGNRYYTSTGKKESITPWLFDYHKKLAKKMKRYQHLFSQNNPRLNPLHNGRSGKKLRQKKRNNKRRGHKQSNHSSKKLREEKMDVKMEEKTTENPRFPPKERLEKQGHDLE